MATIALYGSKLAYDIRIWGESYKLFAAKFLSWLVFWFVLKVVFGHWVCGKHEGLVADLGMAFVDDWVRGTVIS